MSDPSAMRPSELHLGVATFRWTFTEFLYAWNRAERALRSLLVRLVGDMAPAFILTAELGNGGLKNALLSFARHTMLPEEAAAAGHFATYFDRLLAYRNFYVHGLQMEIIGSGGEALGIIEMVSAKGTVKVHRHELTQAELDRALEWAVNLVTGLAILTGHFHRDRGKPLGERPFLPDTAELRENFPWPDTLAKPQDYLQLE